MRITWVGKFNFVFLQWFGIRLARLGWIEEDYFHQIRWVLLLGIIPLTGWSHPFVSEYIGPLKIIQLKDTDRTIKLREWEK